MIFTELIHLGFSNMVAIDKVVAVISLNSEPAKRLVKEVKDKGLLIDMTNHRKTKAALIMNSGHIILAAIAPETIASRVIAGRKLTPREQSEGRAQAE